MRQVANHDRSPRDRDREARRLRGGEDSLFLASAVDAAMAERLHVLERYLSMVVALEAERVRPVPDRLPASGTDAMLAGERRASLEAALSGWRPRRSGGGR